MELAEDEMAKRNLGSGEEIEQATQDAKGLYGQAAQQVNEVIQQNNNNNSSTNVLTHRESARDENDRYYTDVMAF